MTPARAMELLAAIDKANRDSDDLVDDSRILSALFTAVVELLLERAATHESASHKEISP